jgi:hypothetical protein
VTQFQKVKDNQDELTDGKACLTLRRLDKFYFQFCEQWKRKFEELARTEQ